MQSVSEKLDGTEILESPDSELLQACKEDTTETVKAGHTLRNSAATSVWPAADARSAALLPQQVRLVSAPAASSASTIFTSPLSAASISGVFSTA